MTYPSIWPGADGPVDVRPVVASEWHDAAGQARDGGWRFAALYVAGGLASPVIRIVLTRRSAVQMLSCRAADTSVATVTDVFPAAVWDEREAHDLYGWTFVGHRPMRPLVDHDRPTDRWTTPVDGEDPYQVAVGPVHAGVIESGHFRLHVVGERILHLDLQLFYKHRGLEIAAEGQLLDDGLAYVQRACAADAISNAVAYVQACESAGALWPQPGLARVRTVLLELERLYNHLNDVAALCSGVGFSAGNMLFATLKERAQRLNARLIGHRFLFGAVAVGRSELSWDAATVREARATLRGIRRDFAKAWREISFVGSFQERLGGVGVLSQQDATQLGAVGPVARASGVRRDARTVSPRLDYGDFEPAFVEAPTGDVQARLQQRGVELPATLDLLDQLLAHPVGPAGTEMRGAPGRLGIGIVEGPRGQTLCAVEVDGQHVTRVHLRTASYANWPAVPYAVRGGLVPDFPLINKSFELCYACVDR
ncbi:MAG: NADH-quinone oxidoreductase subunit C [Patulibacter sp.]|nr:NADH-quinone oxidoreductase subunit C [Patulibacter sp.]